MWQKYNKTTIYCIKFGIKKLLTPASCHLVKQSLINKGFVVV